MRPFHAYISAVNLVCGVSFIALFLTDGDAKFREILSFISVIGGPVANFIAVIISLVLLVRYSIQARQGNGKKLIEHEWLGLFNGAFVVFCWALFIGYTYYTYPVH